MMCSVTPQVFTVKTYIMAKSSKKYHRKFISHFSSLLIPSKLTTKEWVNTFQTGSLSVTKWQQTWHVLSKDTSDYIGTCLEVRCCNCFLSEAVCINGVNPVVIYFINGMTTDYSSHATSYNTKPDTHQIYRTLRISHDTKFISSGDSNSPCLPLEQYFIKPKVLSLCSQEPTSCLKGAVEVQVLYF